MIIESSVQFSNERWKNSYPPPTLSLAFKILSSCHIRKKVQTCESLFGWDGRYKEFGLLDSSISESWSEEAAQYTLKTSLYNLTWLHENKIELPIPFQIITNIQQTQLEENSPLYHFLHHAMNGSDFQFLAQAPLTNNAIEIKTAVFPSGKQIVSPLFFIVSASCLANGMFPC